MEIGESLVYAYLKYIRRCDIILANTHIDGQQGEIDLIGLNSSGAPRELWLVEVTTHLRGMLYDTQANTVTKILEKGSRARKFAETTFPGTEPQFEVWSPIVPTGILSALQQAGVTVVANEEYTDCVNQLAQVAARSTETTGIEAFRFLQLLTHLRGARPTFADPIPVRD